MTESWNKDGTAQTDLKLVSKIANGNRDAWESFVKTFSDSVLYRSRQWCELHCNYCSPTTECGLLVLHSISKGNLPPNERDECDEGMDIYIWIFDQLGKKINKYSARNNSRLSTFVWSLLNSRELYIDWLRHKYGRVF